MRKFITTLLVLVCIGFVFTQITEKQKWNDFGTLTNTIEGLKMNIQHVYNVIGQIETLEEKVLNDPERKAEVKKLIDLHPDWTVSDIAGFLVKIKNLAIHLELNGLVETEQ